MTEQEQNQADADALVLQSETFIAMYMKHKPCSRDEALKAFVSYTYKQYKRQEKIEQLFTKLGI